MTIEEIRRAVARGWCAPENSAKEMDSDLAEAISQEILKLFSHGPTGMVRLAESLLRRHRQLAALGTINYALGSDSAVTIRAALSLDAETSNAAPSDFFSRVNSEG
jgi:hypothetical protein